MTQVSENMDFTVDGTEDATFEFVNNDGKAVQIPFTSNETAIVAGESMTEDIVVRDGETIVCGALANEFDDCKNLMLWVVSSNGEAHMIKIDKIDQDTADMSNSEIFFEDLTYDDTPSDDLNLTDGASNTLVDAGFVNIQIDVENNASSGSVLTFVGTEAALAETKLGAEIDFTTESVIITEDASNNAETEVTTGIINTTLNLDIDGDLEIGASVTNGNRHPLEEDSDVEAYMTGYGTYVEYDSEDEDYVKVVYPEEAAYGNVFISPTGAEVVSGGSTGAITTTVVQKIQVGAAKLASEVANIKAVNAIVVGGPCANPAAATLMGNPEKCWEAIPENKAIIKLYESGSNVALLVAGRTALDTRRASRVLANADDYDLSGMEVEVTGTSLTDISVSAAQ